MASLKDQDIQILINPQTNVSVCQILSFMICYELITGTELSTLNNNLVKYYTEYYTNKKQIIDNLKLKNIKLNATNQGLFIDDIDKIIKENKLPINISVITDLEELKEKLKINNMILDNTIEEWRGALDQVDDILVIGLRF